MSKFISFSDDGIVSVDTKGMNYLKTIKKPLIIISIIGEARMGKSTFLNTLISHKINGNMKIFNTSSKISHCTVGIDMYHYDDYLFLDFQGISYENSNFDVKLLLIAYLVSNIIICNVGMMNNTCLKLLEPINYYANNLDIRNAQKPKLLFRVKDYNLDSPISTLLEKTLNMQNDHYKGLRVTIKELFNSIDVISTDHLDKQDIKNIRDGNYLAILNEHTGFCEAIGKLLTLADHGDKKSVRYYTSELCNQIDDLNKNNKIIVDDLDLVFLKIENDFLKFKENIKENDFICPQNVTGYESYYVDEIIPKLKKYETLIGTFNEKFANVDPSVRQKYLNTIMEKSLKHVQFANDRNEKLAKQLVHELFNQLIGEQLGSLNSAFRLADIYSSNKLCIFDHISKSIKQKFVNSNILNSVKANFDYRINMFLATLESLFDDSKAKINKQISTFSSVMNNKINKLVNINNIKKSVNEQNIDPEFYFENQPFIKKIINEFSEYYESTVYSHISVDTPCFSINQLVKTIDTTVHYDEQKEIIGSILLVNYVGRELDLGIDTFNYDNYWIEKLLNGLKTNAVFKFYNAYKIPIIRDALVDCNPSKFQNILKNNLDVMFVKICDNQLSYTKILSRCFTGPSSSHIDVMMRHFINDNYMMLTDFKTKLEKNITVINDGFTFSKIAEIFEFVTERNCVQCTYRFPTDPMKLIMCKYFENKLIDYYGKKLFDKGNI